MGLLGLAFHADLLRGTGNDFVYVVFTYDDAPGPALARRMVIRRYRYDQGARALVEPLDILTGLPTHDDHVGGRLAFGPDRKLYLTIGDQGSNFGANRCNANHAQDLPTAADVRREGLVEVPGQDPACRSRRLDPGRQPGDWRRAQSPLFVRPPQPARPRVWTERQAVRVGTRAKLGR